MEASNSSLHVIDAEQLIELVRGFPHLYNPGASDYKDQLKKNNSWKVIAQEVDGVGCSPAECQRRFKGLRDTYMKEKKRLKSKPSGSSGKTKKLWAFYHIVDSLLGEFQEKETQGNVDFGSSTEDEMLQSSSSGQPCQLDNVMTVPYQPKPKKRHTENDPLEEALLASINATNEDSLFGQSVGQTLMRLPNVQKALAKIKIMQILFEAEYSEQ